MRTIAIDINGTDYKARVLPGEENWKPAALRAVQRKFGKTASIWSWAHDCRQVDNAGNTTRVCFKATVVGRKDELGGWPILAEVRLWIAAGDAQ